MSGLAPKIQRGARTFVVQWLYEGKDAPDDIDVHYYEPTSAHYDEAMRRVAQEKLPMNGDSMDRKLVEVCISKVGVEDLSTITQQVAFWSETPEPFRFLITMKFRDATLSQLEALKNYWRRCEQPVAVSPQVKEEASQ